ncbi:hypothetical protein LRD18_09825 [Halorhodospira halochloris]|uniref:hypothetical protein n=1 Tax=Halorhodospira halochloris TaxID=1052 RepID=UPI001EE8D7FA|nr:hypothetical protein [Halorhodospira halochloris]MCG5531163.1 hypothetical protein [Halorhodospira halochloris]
MKNYLAGIVLGGTMFGFGAVSAAPSPFGLEIGASCEAVGQYEAHPQGVSPITGGNVYEIEGGQINFEDLQSVTVVCDEQQNIAAIIALLQKRFGGATFDRLVGMLRDEYKIIGINDAHVGDQDARFKSGDVEILVEEPHMSRTTSLIYKTKDFSEAFSQHQQQQQRQQQEREVDQL